MPFSSSSSGPALADPVDVLVKDQLDQQRFRLERVDARTPAGDLVGLSRSRMTLPLDVEYIPRDNPTSRLLRSDQPVGDVAVEGRVDVTLQPDARLG